MSRARQSEAHQLTDALEMYLKAIYEIEATRGTATVTEIADRLAVKAPSVTVALRRLSDLGMVRYERYRSVRLTKRGKRLARQLNRAYRVFSELFVLLGVPEEIADADACSIEHNIHDLTLRKAELFVEFLRTEHGRALLRAFEDKND